jgi:hypothetical protein
LVETTLKVAAVVGILGALGFVLFVAFAYFEGWRILAAVAAELALLVLLFHIYRWMRYPGLFRSQTFGKLVSNVLLSVLFIYCLPLVGILAKLKLAGFLPLEEATVALGMDFKFKVRQIIQVSVLAPRHAGDVGRILKIHVTTGTDFGQDQSRLGEVVLTVKFADEIASIAEEHLLTFNSVQPAIGLNLTRG